MLFASCIVRLYALCNNHMQILKYRERVELLVQLVPALRSLVQDQAEEEEEVIDITKKADEVSAVPSSKTKQLTTFAVFKELEIPPGVRIEPSS